LGYSAGLLSLAAMKVAEDATLIAHCRKVRSHTARWFYLQPAVGGRVLSYKFWREFAEIEMLSPSRLRHSIVTRRWMSSAPSPNPARHPLYTGNDDNIAMDLLTPHVFQVNGRARNTACRRPFGHWRYGLAAPSISYRSAMPLRTKREAFRKIAPKSAESQIPTRPFSTCEQFRGCIAGLQEVLRRQGLLDGICAWTPRNLSPGQREEIDRVYAAYPHLTTILSSSTPRPWLKP